MCKQRLNYLLTGFMNTVFGYCLSIVIYSLFNGLIPLFLMLVGINIIAITFSFTTYKVLVFKTKGRWVSEYIRCYFVYGLNAIFSISIGWILVEEFFMKFWVAQIVVMAITILSSFLMHKNYTFKKD